MDIMDIKDLSSPHVLLDSLLNLREAVERDGKTIFDQWRSHIQRSQFLPSALNLAQYLALRRHDLRPLQAALMPWGLSSLGRIEARVMANLDAVIATLALICGVPIPKPVTRPVLRSFFEGENRLREQTECLFGPALPHRRVRIMVTLPTEAASEYEMVREIIERGATCLRINCAHDNPSIWEKMIQNIRQAEQELSCQCTVMMDLGGPKIRTEMVLSPAGKNRVFRGDLIVLCRSLSNQAIADPIDNIHISCTVPEILDLLKVGTLVYIDDGKLRTRVVDQDYPLPDGSSGFLLEVTHAKPKGVKLSPEKGLNFPNIVLPLIPLTPKDLTDLDFLATHADIIGYSFVQQTTDIQLLQSELAQRCLHGEHPAIIAKIETAVAVTNLPELIVHAAGKHPFGVMIARGDLAVEIGYQRLAEIQEEILWLCEAAHVPVIWATQVLESLVKEGAPSRGEMTDAAMAERAECVMLNKGPFITQAVTILDDVLTRMEAHQLKKTPQLRALRSWENFSASGGDII